MVLRGKLSRFTHESKFTERINTKIMAKEAIEEGNNLRNRLKNRRVLDLSDHSQLMNAFRL